MTTHLTESGYEVLETLGGLEVSEYGELVCTLDGCTLEDYSDEDTGDIDDETLERDIQEAIEVEEFLAYQKDYC